MKHIIYSNQDLDAAQDALNAGTLENPYIAAIRWYGGIDIDYNTKEQQSCEDRDLCGDDPTDCHECTCEEQYEEGTQELCECQGKYWYNDTCNDEPESEPTCEDQGLCDDGEGNCVECDECGGDPECECNAESGYNWWEDDTCHSCEEEWESLGYSSPEDCACAKIGEDSGVCPEPDPEEE